MLKTTLATLALGLAATAPLHAQVSQDEDAAYKPRLNACLVDEDYACAVDTLIEFGRSTPLGIVVSQGKPTVLGIQLFGSIDMASQNLSPAETRDLAERALNFVLDKQPDSGTAPAPFVLLMGEACLAQGDLDCVRTAIQPLQMWMGAGQMYIKTSAEGTGKPDTQTRIIELSKGFREAGG
ncbi:hypothetical protein [Oceanibium sediminis]|uniref:hypothetical protein n=1 Tax=Oceanibium sediminis TaxID=2026339 RepID=UPI000DD37095|nr:hypothetical protein [Oceanibium sediminis]